MTVLPLLVLLAAPDGGTPLAPLPTDAQCAALGPPKTPFAFGPGETLEFDIDAMGAKAGHMTMAVKPLKDGRLPVEVSIATNTFFSKMRKVRGTGTSYLNPRTLRPARYFEDATENEWHRVADVTFNKPKSAHLVSTINDRTGEADLAFGDEGLDVGGAIYLMRQLPLKEGTQLCFDVYGIRRMWRVWGTVQPREHVSLPLGEFESWHLAGTAARLDLPAMRREIHVWISDDARRLPLAALGAIDIGTVRATLSAYSRPGDGKAAAENKANLKL
jgi:hypothetical protein